MNPIASLDQAFAAARRVPPGPERERLIASLCADDAALRDELVGLLAHHDAAETERFGEVQLELADPVDDAAEAAVPERLGRFRIHGLLGTGATGVVFDAEDTEGQRRVALKLLRPEAITASVHARFRREARLLAQMDHPGIVRLFAVETIATPAGPREALVLERVPGRPLTEHARTARWSIERRLHVLIRVCEAVEHAHRKGVLHRDLKPGNVLIAEDGTPKVLDFGVGQPLDPHHAATRFTSAGFLIGTLGYMSPEQLSGSAEGLDTRSDVYGLGAIAYELLGGRPPCEAPGLELAEWIYRLQRHDPPSLRSISPRISRDLSRVVGKAMARDPDRRYAGPYALAADLRRVLRGEAIEARAPTWRYRTSRFIARHRAAVVLSGLALAAILTSLVLALLAARDESRERERAARLAADMAIHAATRDLDAFDATAAAELLSTVEPAHRGWAWRHLASRLDESSRHVELGEAALAVLSLNGREALVRRPDASLVLKALTAGRETRVRGAAPARGPMALSARDMVYMGAYRTLYAVDREQSGTQQVLRLDRGKVESIVLHAASRRALLLVGHRGDDEVLIWNLATGRVEHRRTVASDQLLAGVWHPAGQSVFVAGSSGSPLWRVPLDDAQAPMIVRTEPAGVFRMAMSPKGDIVATGSMHGSIALVSTADGRARSTTEAHRSAIVGLAFDASGARLASVAEDRSVRVWDTTSGAALAGFAGQREAPWSLRFAGGEWHTIGTEGVRTFQLQRRDSWRRATPHRGRAEGNEHPYVYGIAYDRGGERIASAGWDGTVRILDARTASVSRTLDCDGAPLRDVAWSSDGRWLGACGKGLWVWEMNGSRPSLTRTAQELGSRAVALAMHPDGSHVAVLGVDGAVRQLALPDGAPREGFGAPAGASGGMPAAKMASATNRSRGGKADICYSEDGTSIFVTAHGANGGVFQIDARRGSHMRRLDGPVTDYHCLCVDRRGRVAAGGADGRIALWRQVTAPRTLLRGHPERVFGLAFHRDGELLASAGNDNVARIWRIADRTETLVLRGHDSYVHDVAFSPDGRTVITCGGDNALRRWHAPPPTEDDAD